MLLTLRLSNFAVMEEVEVAFGPGLTVLTGETGAGKSILIDALSLVLGSRAEAEVVRTGADEAVIEALFEKTEVLGARLEELGLPDLGGEVSVRRAVGRTGRGRVHVNGSLTTVGMLARLMRGLVDIAGQNEHTALFDPSQHRALVDRFGEVDGEVGPLQQYRRAWASLKELDARLGALGGDDAQVRTRVDYLSFLLDELDRAAPVPGEDAALEQERRRLASVERLRQLATSAEELLTAGEAAASELVGRAVAQVGEGERLDPALARVREALVGAQAELDEAGRALSRYGAGLDADPARLAELDERLDALRRLSRKHGTSIDALCERREALRAELLELSSRAERRAEVEALRVGALAEADRLAQQLRRARGSAAEALTEAVSGGLARLAMPRARFEVALSPAPLGPDGADEVHLLFSANAGEAPRPLARVASGGEASRIMLALKAALAGSDGCVCSVFDEADAGVGGAVADVVGRLVKEVSAHRQVLCITHLPQVAAHADTHVRIDKRVVAGRTHAATEALEAGPPRARELARMLSGVEVSQEALGAAEALLRSAARVLAAPHARKRNRPRPGARQPA